MSKTELSLLPVLDAIYASCIDRLVLMQERELEMPPDGFLIFDEGGHEVRRWFASARP